MNTEEIEFAAENLVVALEAVDLTGRSPEEVQRIIDLSLGRIDKELRPKLHRWVDDVEGSYRELYEEACELGEEDFFGDEHLRVITTPGEAWGCMEGDFFWHSSTGW